MSWLAIGVILFVAWVWDKESEKRRDFKNELLSRLPPEKDLDDEEILDEPDIL